MCAEIDDVLALLQKLFNELPEEKVAEIPPDDLYMVAHNLLKPNLSEKHRSYGFLFLTSYINLMRKVKTVVPDVSYATLPIIASPNSV